MSQPRQPCKTPNLITDDPLTVARSVSSADLRPARVAHGRLARALLALLPALTFVLLARKGHLVIVDSHSYLDHHILRTPGYPLYLDLMRHIGGAHALKLAHVVQVLCGVLAAAALARTLRLRVLPPARRHPLAEAALFTLLVVPLFRCGETLATEALSYAAFLLLLDQIARSFSFTGSFTGTGRGIGPGIGPILGAAGAFFVLLLLRPQFLFLVPPGLLYIGWWLLRGRVGQGLLAALAIAAAIGLAGAAQVVYNGAVHGTFTRIPATGIQVLTIQLYIAPPVDISRAPGTEINQAAPAGDAADRFLATLRERVTAARISIHHRQPDHPAGAHFSQVYNAICYGTILATYEAMVGKRALAPADWLALDALSLRASLRLARAQAGQAVFFMIKELQESAGYLPLFMVLLLGFSLPLALRGQGGPCAPAALFMITAVACGLANYALVALFEPLGARYLMYTENIQAPALVTLLLSLWPPRNL